MLPDNTIVYAEQEEETFLFYSIIEENKNDKNENKNIENKIIDNNEDDILPYQK